MNYLLWFFISCAIIASGCGYIGWRIIHASDLEAPWKFAAWVSLAAIALLIPFSFFLQINRIVVPGGAILTWISSIGMGFFSLLLTIVLMRDLAWILAALVERTAGLAAALFGYDAGTLVPADPERRRLLIRSMSIGLVVAAGGLTAYGFFEARRRPRLVNVSVPLPALHPDLQGIRILQITDIHAGITVGRDFVQSIVAQANEQSPDIIVFTGDLVDGTVERLRDIVAPMKDLSAPLGKFFITGNHEYYSGAEPWVKEAARLGFIVLLNEHRIVRRGAGSLLMAGVTDYSGGQFLRNHASDPAKAFAGAPACDARILLAHQPKSLRAALPHGFDLQISGHTHGGQFFPWNLLAAVDQPYISGLHRHENSWIYVSRGTGYWGPPIRIAARSEITLFTLRSG